MKKKFFSIILALVAIAITAKPFHPPKTIIVS